MKRFFAIFIGVCFLFTSVVHAADAENTLMIEITGEANGIVEIELLPDVAPKHVERIKRLTREGKYDGIVFHRVINKFMAQTGDVRHGKHDSFILRYAGLGGSDYPDLPAELTDIPFRKGIVGMARSQGLNTANSQFFIMFADAPSLNKQYTVFGRVISGQDVVDAIRRGSKHANGAVKNPDYMKRVWIKADEGS